MKTYRSNASSYKRLVRGIWFRLALIALLALSLLVLPQMFSAQASAGRNAPQGFLFVVNTTDDHNDFSCGSDDCTLREAIQAANNIPTDDTILFSVTGLISLTSALPAITDDVEIAGPGSQFLIVRRGSGVGGSFRIFNVTTTGTVSFSGLTVEGSTTFNEEVGGIRNSSTGTVNVTNCEVRNGGADAGGGIANSSTGTVNVTNSEVSGNRAFTGGGISNSGTVNVTNCEVSDNLAGSAGGGILNNGTLDVRNSTIVNNKADGGGGIFNGINNNGFATANITNSTISGNKAISGNDGGGGIGNLFGTVNITGSTISNNSVINDFASGGGIHNGFNTNPSFAVNVVNSIIRDNEAPFGGGISNSATVNVRNSTINNNRALGRELAAGHGGGIDNPNGTVDVSNSTISGNSATFGGGIANFFDACTVSVTNSTISGNSATFGGGIHNRRAGTVNLTNSTISGNSGTANPAFGPAGGGVANPGTGPFNVKSSIIALNTAAAGADLSGAFASDGFNLIGRTNGGTGFTAPTDLTGTDASILNPQFDPNGLQDNGGPTQTIALLPGGPAIDKGTSFGLTGTLLVDQRGTGFQRTFDDPAVAPATGGDNTDIGAFELQPLPMTSGASVLINESCPPANGAIDPGERVTVNLELINTTNAAASNLVATLQTSGGVLAPSAPQNYGAIAANSSVARDFSFTAEGSLTSGQTITATLHLQDGATNLGTVSFTFTAGPTPCSFVRLVVTSSLSRADASTVDGAITVQNIGSLAANDVMLTTAKLGATNGTPLPQGLGNLAPGALASVTVNFNNSTPGSSSMLTAGGTYTGGTFSSSKRVTLP